MKNCLFYKSSRSLILFSVLILFFILNPAWVFAGEKFIYQHVPGESYRILSEVTQDVYVNGRFSHQAFILNRITAEILSFDEARDSASIRASYMTSEESLSAARVYKRSNEYEVEFTRNSKGEMDVPKEAFVPTVRNVPVFPAKDLEIGEVWTAMASEVHDFRDSLGLRAPLTFPMKVSYTYKGKEEIDDQVFDVIEASYTVSQRFPRTNRKDASPVFVSGSSELIIYWDSDKGRPSHYQEEYLFSFTLADGRTIVFQGTASARLVQTKVLDTEDLRNKVQSTIDDKNLQDVSVREDEEGITIALENIQFAPDSARLLESEYPKLEAMADILKSVPEYDLLITGHTALAGDAAGRKKLSEERAQVVGEYLLSKEVRQRDQILYEGKGAEEPLADNATEAGKKRNRRVEITIRKN